MISEIFEIEPASGVEIADLAKEGQNIQLREELGLPEVERKDENAPIFNFRPITEEENKVYSILFPVKTEIKDYKKLIPTEVLEAAKAFQDSCPHRIVEEFEIWDAKDYDPDPILTVGVRTQNDEYDFANKIYLIARWGIALENFEVLKKKAFEKWKGERSDSLNKAIIKMKSELKIVKNAYSIGNVEDISFYGLD